MRASEIANAIKGQLPKDHFIEVKYCDEDRKMVRVMFRNGRPQFTTHGYKFIKGTVLGPRTVEEVAADVDAWIAKREASYEKRYKKGN